MPSRHRLCVHFEQFLGGKPLSVNEIHQKTDRKTRGVFEPNDEHRSRQIETDLCGKGLLRLSLRQTSSHEGRVEIAIENAKMPPMPLHAFRRKLACLPGSIPN